MQANFWHERWNEGRTAFHQPAVDRSLCAYWRAAVGAHAARVFVPLCGKSLDLLWLRDAGHDVTGVELSDVALQAFCAENGVPARRRVLPGFDRYEAPHLMLYRGDIFALTPALVGRIDAVYDRAALISWAPELRAAYAAQMTALTGRGTTTLLISLEYPSGQMQGPPFAVERREIDRLYAGSHSIEELGRRDALADEPRMRARGLRELREVCYRLVRK